MADEDFTPGQKVAICAQSFLETGKGNSFLAKEHNNFCGMQWRDVHEGISGVSKVQYTSPSDGLTADYISCSTPENFLKAYKLFIGRKYYEGWEKKTHSFEYIAHLLEGGYATDDQYISKVSKLFTAAEDTLNLLDPSFRYEVPSDPGSNKKPRIDIVKNSPNQSARTTDISRIVLHNTAGSFDGAVSWLCNPQARASAHYVVSRSGKIAQLVPNHKKAWHAGNAAINNSSIGIEIEATSSNKGMTLLQSDKVKELVRWLMAEYNISKDMIGIHRWYSSTDCPVLVFSTDELFKRWLKNV